MLFSMIVAHDLDYIIGQDDKLAWKSKEDLSWFVRKTKNKAIVMGSTTAKGIGRALPGRVHYVLTSNPGQFENIPELLAYSSFEDIAVDASRKGYNEIVICGGVSIYKQLLDRVQKLYVTEIPIRSKEECEKDNDNNRCEYTSHGGSHFYPYPHYYSYGGTGSYAQPFYRSRNSETFRSRSGTEFTPTRTSSGFSGVKTVTRSGFGSTSRSHSSFSSHSFGG